MLRSYLKTALRNLLRHKTYTVLNVAGLALGIALCLLAFQYLRDEASFDAFHEKADRIYQVVYNLSSEVRNGRGERHLTNVIPVLANGI